MEQQCLSLCPDPCWFLSLPALNPTPKCEISFQSTTQRHHWMVLMGILCPGCLSEVKFIPSPPGHTVSCCLPDACHTGLHLHGNPENPAPGLKMGGRAAARRAGQCPLRGAGPGDKRGVCHGSEMPRGSQSCGTSTQTHGGHLHKWLPKDVSSQICITGS